MAPDDPSGIRELRFRHGSNHVIVTVSPDGSGTVRVIGGVYNEIAGDERKDALKAALKMLSVARHLVFEEFVETGGTVEELREETGPVPKL